MPISGNFLDPVPDVISILESPSAVSDQPEDLGPVFRFAPQPPARLATVSGACWFAPTDSSVSMHRTINGDIFPIVVSLRCGLHLVDI